MVSSDSFPVNTDLDFEVAFLVALPVDAGSSFDFLVLVKNTFFISESGSSGSGSSGGSGYAGNLGVDDVLKEIIFQIEKKENYDDVLKDLEVYVYENPENAHAWNFIGFTSRKLGKYDDAELYYNTGLEISPNHEGILSYQGELFLQTGRYELALENLEKLTDLCNFNCTEKKALSDAIVQYESENNL